MRLRSAGAGDKGSVVGGLDTLEPAPASAPEPFATKEGSRGRSLVAGDGTTRVGHFGGTGGLLGVAAPKPAVGRPKRHHLPFREVAEEVCQICFNHHAAVSVRRSIRRGDCGRGHGAFGEEECASKLEELLVS
jgi:hypothetical protein